MRRDPRAYLWDVHEAIRSILEFLGDADFAGYASSPMLQAAVERKFEIIGEALGQLAKHAPELAERIPQVARVVAFRNILIHGYAVIETHRVWRIAKDELPGLLDAVVKLKDELGG